MAKRMELARLSDIQTEEERERGGRDCLTRCKATQWRSVAQTRYICTFKQTVKVDGVDVHTIPRSNI